MIEIRQTEEYEKWFKGLRDIQARARILVKIDRLTLGIKGNTKSVGGGVSELKIDYGPGYRVYFTRRGQRIVLLLFGGDKSSQKRDIKRAQKLAEEV